MFKLKEVWAKNFRSYKEFHIKDFSNLNLTLINGGNGAGKSTLRLTIEYLLTDSMSEDLNTDEFTFDKKGNCELGCIIEDDKENTIKIIKYREHKKHKNSTILEINGDSETFTENDRRQTQKNIEELLGVNKDSLSISTIFSKDSKSFPECKESDRKKILYDALQLHEYTVKENKVKEEIKKVENKINVFETKVSFTKDYIEEGIVKIDTLHDKSKYWEINRQEKLKRMKGEIDEINKKDDTIILEGYKEKKKEYANKIVDFYFEIDELKKGLIVKSWAEEGELTEQQKLFKKYKIQAEFELSKLKKSKDMVGECPVLGSFCQLLSDKVEEVKKNKLVEESLIEKQIKEHSDNLYLIESKLKEYEKIHLQNEDTNKKIRDLERIIDQIKREIYHTEEKITAILLSIEEKKDRIQKIEDAKKEIEKELDPFIEMIILEKVSITKMKQEIIEIEETLTRLYDDIQYWNFLKVAYSKSGIPNMKMEGFLESLELETNKILSGISDKIYIKIDSQGLTKSGEVREKIDYSVNHPNKTITNFYSYSGGERHRVNLASMFAFNKLLSNLNFIVLDEVLELSLDAIGKEDVIKLLKNKITEVDTILCVSHDDSIKDNFISVMNIKKIDEVSHIRGL